MCDTMAKLLPNGKAIFGKNSDRSPNEPQALYWYPASVHQEKKIQTTYIEVNQVKETKSVILSRPLWMWGAEMGVNECGVCIGNEAVFTKGKYGKTGLTGMDLVRLALERCENAKNAVECMIQLLECYGQGGNCGFDHDFYYDNSFLIMDGKEIYVLETAGKKWVYQKFDCTAISNRLSLTTECDAYSDNPCDFKKKYTEPVYSYFSQAANRRKFCKNAIDKVETVTDIFGALRQHTHDGDPLCKASVGSPCMHYGGLVGDHSTQSLVVEWSEKGEMLLWATGCSTPCISIFKPHVFGNPVDTPFFAAEDPTAKEYWLKSEYYHRNFLGYKLPKEYYAERDAIEADLIQKSRNLDPAFIYELGKEALKKEQEFRNKWENAALEKGKTSYVFRNNWLKKNEALEK